ncbi:hypothetical protein B0H63DRAFT_181951 [Podospora didyma]|uniref:MYND-type domain-containing protein n=1 Tax=Podospora didyma TaxID=330526 RepID=A0AAE0NPW0_9PEZI|nr:hypothetical protein B0H63DRAFT_181951 [Podospora didyma]
MLIPAFLGCQRPFYAVGNTPAFNLTRCVPQGVDADILLLGCGDVRHILYTSYANVGFPSRKLDITACDIEPNIIARNTLLLALILDADKGVSLTQIWNVFYHFYLDEKDMQLLGTQAKKLLALSESLKLWHGSIYGKTLRFCDEDTLLDVRSIWEKHAESVQLRNTTEFNNQFKANMQKSLDYKDAAWGKEGVVFTSARSAAPLGTQMFKDLAEATQRQWATGLSSSPPRDTKLFPNPMLSVALSDLSPLAYPADPLLSFHLATADANLTKASPLRLPDTAVRIPGEPENLGSRLFEAALVQFREWTNAFRTAAPKTTIRFVVADCFSLCHTLQANLDTGDTCAHWYRQEIGFKALRLAESEYGKTGKSPKQFDVIDTSNVSDYYGAVNVLASAGPLLKDGPSSTLYTELMARGKASEKAKFESLLCGHTRTTSILLGLAPIEYWTNATAVSVVDECLITLSAGRESIEEGLKIQSRLAWKQARYLSGPSSIPSKLHVKADELETTVRRVYEDMLQNEIPDRDGFHRTSHVNAHRATFVAFLKAIGKTTVPVGPEPSVAQLFLERLTNDDTLLLRKFHWQELLLKMSQLGLYTTPKLTLHTKPDNPLAAFWKWTEIPPVVAVTLVVPAAQWKAEHQRALHMTGGLTLQGLVRTPSPSLYSDVQITFGTIEMQGSPDQDDFAVLVREDQDRWGGSSPMIATFNVSTVVLGQGESRATVSLVTYSSIVRSSAMGHDLESTGLLLEGAGLFSTNLLSEDAVFISKNPPGQNGDQVVGSAPPISAGASTVGDTKAKSQESEAVFTANIDTACGDIVTITGHQSIQSAEGKKLLAAKVSIELWQSSPFTININFGENSLNIPVTFPVPVQKDGSKTRVARTSSYIEVIAPIAEPMKSAQLKDYIIPCVLSKPSNIPSALNAPHLSLDTLPILALDDKTRTRFLTTFVSFMYSARERTLRETANQKGISASTRVNFKESIFTMFMLSSGLQGGQTGLFAISHPDRGGVHMLFFVSAIRLDGANASVVLDAAVLPLTNDLVRSNEIYEFLLVVQGLEIATINVNDAELLLWKKAVPALAERCRTWNHKPGCEYKKLDATIPLSLDDGVQLLCSCGMGKLPPDFVSLPEWSNAAAHATRIAISPIFATPFVEDLVGVEMANMISGTSGKGKGQGGQAQGEQQQKQERVVPVMVPDGCRACGKIEGDGGKPLKKCLRCKKVKYCSPGCQKKDWTKHRLECMEEDDAKTFFEKR